MSAVTSTGASGPVLRIRDLEVSYSRRGRRQTALHRVNLDIRAGECHGLVGESGSGKSTLSLAIMRHLSSGGQVDSGAVELAGDDLLKMDSAALRDWRGRRVAMVYQDPAKALNPSMRIGEQMGEIYRYHFGTGRQEALTRAEAMLRRVAFDNPADILSRFPHQLSGGQQQRIVIAMALAADPELLILDEPTTGLDATVEAEVLALLETLRAEASRAILFISHNLGLIGRMCERVTVLYSGRVVEQGPTGDVLQRPKHPYAAALLGCVPHFGIEKDTHPLVPIPGSPPALGALPVGCVFAPRCANRQPRCMESEPELATVGVGHVSRCYYPDAVAPPMWDQPLAASVSEKTRSHPIEPRSPLLAVRGLSKAYGKQIACDSIDLDIQPGEVLGLVGESGSGKSTLARMIAGLSSADSGDVLLKGAPLDRDVARRGRAQLRAVQMVFQSPDSSLNRRHTARFILRRAVSALGGARSAEQLAALVRVPPELLYSRAGRLSGGQKQRIATARAFAGDPELVICDEPVSSLDVSVQAAVLNLLVELQEREKVSYLFISHDLAVVRYLADRIAVMYLGQIVDIGPADEVFSAPYHPYTAALLAAIPKLGGPKFRSGSATVLPRRSDGDRMGAGCRFSPRCPHSIKGKCDLVPPPWQALSDRHQVRCHLTRDELIERQQVAFEATPVVPMEVGIQPM
ncbi:MAG TPA: ABC transporter ATP-binding protein [Bauldia sp.]|nr:ABC transporter ATP-binding protein [Bauldia sp.]